MLFHGQGSILGSFLFALSGWLMGALGHDAGHFAVSRIPWINEWCVWAMSFISNPIVWQHQHTYAHHSFTNEFESDPDLHHFHLLLRVHERVQIHRKYRKQSHWQYVLYAYMFAIFATCVGIPIVMANKGHLYSVVNWQDMSRPTKNLGLRLHVALYVLLIMVIPLFTNPTPLQGLVAVFVHMVTMGIVFAAFSQINHLTETALQADMDTRRTKKRELPEHTTSIVDDSWAATQVETSNNFAPNSLFWYIVSNGLNHQIEHHLFPGLNHCHLHHIVPVVQQTCEEYGVHYKSYESFSSLTAALLTWFEKLSGDHKKKELVKNPCNKAVSQKAQ